MTFYIHVFCLMRCRLIVSQSVKEVLQSLVDDGLVQADKIGISNCESLRTLKLSLFITFSMKSFGVFLRSVVQW